MPDLEEMTPGQVLADTNVATFIADLGLGIARAQKALDENSLAMAIELATTRPEFSNRSLLELGFSPTFYHYQHADVEVSLQITMRVERSTSVNVRLNADFSHSDGSSTEGSGEASITVNFGGGGPATATLRLAEAGPGSVTIGATTLALQTAPATSPNVAVVPESLSGTARALADRMSDPPEAVPDVLRASVELVEGGTPLTATTDTSTVFDVSRANRIVVNDTAATPARAWVAITGAGTIQLRGSDTGTWTASPNAPDAAVAAINGVTGYRAVRLFRAGRSEPKVHFDHNRGGLNDFNPDNDIAVLDPVIDLLKAAPSITVRVVGHADQSGEDPRNQALSLERASTVREHLVSRGVPAAQITEAIGRSESQPINNRPGQRDDANRRVELELTSAQTDVLLIETTALGSGAVWGADRPSLTGGSRLAAVDGRNALTLGGGARVSLDGHDFITSPGAVTGATQHSWSAGADAAGTARALAASIVQHTAIDAFAQGNVVRLLPLGSHALIRLVSQARNAAANSLALQASGSLSREAPFSGASEGGEPASGDTVTIGATALTCTTDASPGTRQFAKGADAAATATSLAAAIGRISGMRATAAAAVVTLTGLSGTRLSTSNSGAFQLSASAIAGDRPTPERSERNTTVAAGLSLEVGYARRFGLDVTGNSRIAARLVSVPAPIELLDEIRTFLGPQPAPLSPPSR